MINWQLFDWINFYAMLESESSESKESFLTSVFRWKGSYEIAFVSRSVFQYISNTLFQERFLEFALRGKS